MSTNFPSEGIGPVDEEQALQAISGGGHTQFNWQPSEAFDENPNAGVPDDTTFEADEAGRVETTVEKPRSLYVQMLGVFVQNKMAVLFTVLLIAITLFSFLGPFFYHTNQTDIGTNIGETCNQAPGPGHPLGTDHQCFDMLGRLMVGGQNSLKVGFLAAGVAMILGVAYGVFSGYKGGKLDTVLMRFLDVLLSIPGLFLVIALTTIFGRTVNLMIIVIGVTGWYGVARLMRAESLSLREREYAQAVRSMGGSSQRVVWHHIVPNSISTTVTLATFAIGDSILALAALGFLGFGILTPATDWGSMLNSGLFSLQVGWWWEVYPVIIVFLIVVMSFNYIGDAFRDSFEVRLRER
jgi:peptide/nickel transport system permease protein